MMTCQETQKLEAYLDGELDLAGSLAMESHLQSCEECRASQSRYEALGGALRQPGVSWEVPQGLAGKIRRTTVDEPARKPAWRWAAMAAGVAACLLTGAMADHLLVGPAQEQTVAQAVTEDHIRSLLGTHATDVLSSDQHTVKPWFNGKLDFTPTVKDLATKGFPLLGGRIDYLENRTVAALVYQRKQHPINLFEWPSQGTEAPTAETVRGYHLIQWKESGMAYWAISDLNGSELSEFVRDLRTAP